MRRLRRQCDKCGFPLRGKRRQGFVSDDGKIVSCCGTHIKPNGWTGLGCPVPWPRLK